MSADGISTIEDFERLEAVPLAERGLQRSVLEVTDRGRIAREGRVALAFIPDATRTEVVRRCSYDALIGAEQTANDFFVMAAYDACVFAILPPGRVATGNVALSNDDRSNPCAQAVVVYALPPRSVE